MVGRHEKIRLSQQDVERSRSLIVQHTRVPTLTIYAHQGHPVYTLTMFYRTAKEFM